MERYEAYRDSGVEWIGEVPDKWDCANLGSITKQRKNLNKDGEVDNVLSLSYGSIKRRVMDNTGLLPESFNTYNVIEDGDIVLRLTDLQNDQRSLRVGLCHERGIITAAYTTLVPQSVDSRYLFYALAAFDYWKGFYGLAGGVRQSLTFDGIRSLRFPLPSQHEQQAIASYLDDKTAEIDGLVADCEREVELLQEYRKAVISEVVTKGLDPNVPMKDSGIKWIGAIPERWGLPRLGMLLSGMKDGTHSTHERVEDGHPLLSAKNVRETCIVISDHESMITEEDYRAIIACGYPAMGDVLLTTIGGSIGRAVVYTLTEVYAFQRSVMFLRPMKALLDSRFLCYMLRSNLMQRQMFERAAASAQDGIYSGDIARYKAILPPLHEQASIADFLDAKTLEIDTLIEAKQQMAEKLREYRRSLISEAVTGKFKVPGV